MGKKTAIALFSTMIVLLSFFSFARMLTTNVGTWPDSWPKELDQFRGQAKSMQVSHSIQENVYEIRFESRQEFDRAWTHILKLKTKGAPLIIDGAPSYYPVSGTTAEAGVRILAPSLGGSLSAAAPDTELFAGPPWPDYLRLPYGGLPEYVVNRNGKWIDYDRAADDRGFRHRARVDIVLITDGKIVDLNHIKLPPDTPIIDKRWTGKPK